MTKARFQKIRNTRKYFYAAKTKLLRTEQQWNFQHRPNLFAPFEKMKFYLRKNCVKNFSRETWIHQHLGKKLNKLTFTQQVLVIAESIFFKHTPLTYFTFFSFFAFFMFRVKYSEHFSWSFSRVSRTHSTHFWRILFFLSVSVICMHMEMDYHTFGCMRDFGVFTFLEKVEAPEFNGEGFPHKTYGK